MPFNIVIAQEIAEEEVEVAAIDPIASMQAIQNPELGKIAIEVQAKLRKIIDNL
jgi:hypothetical protein